MYYGQNKEDKVILEYFGDFVGVLLDIGANDGRTLSNSLALIEKGWGGALVEASPKAFERLSKEHQGNKKIELHNFALAGHDGEIEFNESGELLGCGDVALVSSTKQNEMDRWTSLNMPFEKMKVPCKSFASFIKDSKYKQYDFISIDVEGMELEILPQINFDEVGSKLACIEFNGKDKQKYDAIMLPFGFRVIQQNAENLIYAKLTEWTS